PGTPRFRERGYVQPAAVSSFRRASGGATRSCQHCSAQDQLAPVTIRGGARKRCGLQRSSRNGVTLMPDHPMQAPRPQLADSYSEPHLARGLADVGTSLVPYLSLSVL